MCVCVLLLSLPFTRSPPGAGADRSSLSRPTRTNARPVRRVAIVRVETSSLLLYQDAGLVVGGFTPMRVGTLLKIWL